MEATVLTEVSDVLSRARLCSVKGYSARLVNNREGMPVPWPPSAARVGQFIFSSSTQLASDTSAALFCLSRIFSNVYSSRFAGEYCLQILQTVLCIMRSSCLSFSRTIHSGTFAGKKKEKYVCWRCCSRVAFCLLGLFRGSARAGASAVSAVRAAGRVSEAE